MVLYLGWSMLANRILSIFATEDTSVALRFAYIEGTLAMRGVNGQEGLWSN